jgi:uncharacterized protein YjbI with pentapeptide repeats
MLKKTTTEELISRYEAGERDFRGAKLAGANLNEVFLVGADFRGANLAGAYLYCAILARSSFADADLAGAYLVGAELDGADFDGADLAGANLAGADLRGAYLIGADLAGADLAGADLRDANLAGADLAGAILKDADLAGANLAGANLAGAKLARTEFEGAIFAGVTGLPEIEPFPLDAKIAEAVADGAHLDMSTWHNSCGTAHCRAGWAVTLHPQGPALEAILGINAAASLIYHACSVSERTPDWFADSAEALADIRRLAELAAKDPATPADG